MNNLIICFLLGGGCGYLLRMLTHKDKLKFLIVSEKRLSEEEIVDAIRGEYEEDCDK